MPDLLLGIDCSTTAAKAVAWDRGGKGQPRQRRGRPGPARCAGAAAGPHRRRPPRWPNPLPPHRQRGRPVAHRPSPGADIACDRRSRRGWRPRVRLPHPGNGRLAVARRRTRRCPGRPARRAARRVVGTDHAARRRGACSAGPTTFTWWPAARESTRRQVETVSNLSATTPRAASRNTTALRSTAPLTWAGVVEGEAPQGYARGPHSLHTAEATMPITWAT
jgi:hypothetical protein